MADNIKIVGSILNTTTVTRYNTEDTNLIPSTQIQESFGGINDYIESYVYDIGGNLLNVNYNYLSYKIPTNFGLTPGINTLPNTQGRIQTTNVGIDSTLSTPTSSLYPIIEIDPIKDLQDLGYSSGEFNVRYNFFNSKLSNYINEALFVKEISSDRTEIRLASTTLTDADIENTTNSLIELANKVQYQLEYLLNFGNNEQYVAVNVALNKATTGYEILFKLYQPLPLNIQEKSTLWIVEEKVAPYIFDINLDKLVIPTPPPKLRGPNFNIPIENQGTISTSYNTYDGLVNNLQSLQSSSYHQILNLLNSQSIDINIDYTNFDNFVFFGSAKQRITNFYSKTKQIEDYTTLIGTYTAQTSSIPSLITEINQYKSNINNIISQFDGYESYLYFESSSYAWPKSGSLKPFTLLPSSTSTVINWYNNILDSTADYDSNNYNNLEFAIPSFVRDDQTNQPFLLFLNMVGHYFDNIWVYLKSITDINLANNNIEYGISKDLVYEHLRSLGVKLYNSQAGESVASYLVGSNTGSSTWDNDFTITGSYLNNVPRKDLVSELYKRIYHNLPLLLKTKGTVTGLEHLITTFGITGSILNIKEYGGGTKDGLIRGYDNEKVRIVANTITGSVLSSELSLQTFPTASSKFRDEDTHYIDISFSPETQIDTYVSGAIASNNPTWNLDDYIGDPRQQYSGSYPNLDTQRKLYFQTGVSGFAPFTASLLDYNGFIRLIEYFDNSLFKMLNDFVPERTSLSTGITINSPVLERNKAVYSIPNINVQDTNTGDISSSTIVPQYGSLYDELQGDKKPFFTGELSGSVVNIYQYFEDNYNPYLGDINVYNSQHTITESVNLNTFAHSDWNVLLNNVSRSIESNYRKGIEYIYGTTSSLTSSIELQDSYLSLKSYNTSRYDGSQLTSLKYNTYTSSSYTGSNGRTIQNGDKSFGKTATIDHNSYKIGWIKSIPSQSLNFYNKTSINLEYLINSSNQVTELNSYNHNICEVQNTFKSGTPTILSISDMNQNKRDGEKTIWKGGYSFNPILYRENGEVMKFRYDEYLYTSSYALGFIATDKNTYQYSSGRGNTPDRTIVNINAQNYFRINGALSSTVYDGAGVVADRVYSNSQWSYNNIPKLSTLPSNCSFFSNNPTRQIDGPIYRFNIFNLNNYRVQQFTGVTIDNPLGFTPGFNNEPISSSIMNHVYKVPRAGSYYINGGVKCKVSIIDSQSGWSMFKVALIVEKATTESNYQNDIWEYVGVSDGIAVNSSNTQYSISNGSVRLDPSGNNQASISVGLRLPVTSTYTLNAGDYIRFSFVFIDIQQAFSLYADDIQLQFSDIHWGVRNVNQSVTSYIYDAEYTSVVPLFNIGTTYQTNDTINFTTSGSEFFYSSSFIDNSPNYSPVISKMSVQPQDLIKFGKFEDPGTHHEVIKVSGYPYSVVVSDSILTGSIDMSGNFAILRPKLDETSVILEGKKVTGIENINKAVLIPYDASTNLKDSVGSIIKSVNTSI